MGLVTEYIVGGYHAGEGAYVWRTHDLVDDARLVVHCHPSGGNALSFPTFRRDMAKLVGGGRALVVDPDLGGTETWGNDTSIARVDEVIAWAAATYGTATDRVSLIGDSMGALTALGWAWRNTAEVGGVVCRLPVVALDAFHDANRLSKATAIEGAYGGLTPYNAAVATHDPSASGPVAAIAPVASRVLLMYSTDDPAALPAEVTAYQAATRCRALPLGPVGHGGPGYYPGVPDDYQARWLLR